MAEKDAYEKALEDLMAGLSEPAPKKAEEEEKEKKSAAPSASSRDAVGEKMSQVDEMAADLEQLLSSASLTEHVEAAKAEEEAKLAEEKMEMEDMETALASALAAPAEPVTAATFDEIEEAWEEPETQVAPVPGEPIAVAPADITTLYQAPAKPGVEEVVVVEPEKLSEKRKRFYAKTSLGIAAAALLSFLFFTYLIQPSLRAYYYHLLVSAVKEKRYADADQHLLKSETFGMTKEKFMKLSDIALENKDIPHSLGFARKAFEIAPVYVHALNRIARIYILQGRIDEAENNAKNTLVIDPDNLEALTLLATAYYKKQDIPKAQRRIADVLARDRNYVPALELSRDIYIDLKNYSQALTLQHQLTEVKKDIPEAQKLLDLGKIYYSDEKFSAAEGYLKQAFEKDPTLWEAGYFLAKSQIGLGKYYLAGEQITRTLKEAPSPTLDMYHLRAVSNYELGNIRTAIEELQRIRVINPKYAPLYVLMGKIFVHTYGEYEAGLKYLEQARTLKFEDKDFFRTLGEAYFRLRRHREALEAWKPLLANIAPTDPFLFRVSACLIHLKQMELAETILLNMQSKGSRATAIQNNRGVIYELLGNRDQALRFYFKATQIAVTQGRKDSAVPKKNFDRLISKQGDLDVDLSVMLQP